MSSTDRPLQVCLDISKLGQGYRQAQQAGIFRYTHELALGLMATPDCQLTLCAGDSLASLAGAAQFLKTETPLGACPFRVHPHLEHNLDQVGRYLDRIETWSTALHQRGIKRTKRLKEALWQLKTPRGGLIGPRHLDQIEIYHSTYACASEVVNHPTVKIFVTVHDLMPVMFPDWFLPAIREQFAQVIATLTANTWILCVSESTKRDLLTIRPEIDPYKVFVSHLAASSHFHPHASDQQKQHVKSTYGIPSEGQYFLSLSTLEIRKNIAHLIRAFAALMAQEMIPDLYLVLAGQKGWLGEDIERTLNALAPNLRQRIRITGYVADQDLAALYGGAIAFIYPSLYEGFGLPPLEAMQCGTPVIVAQTSSLPEVVGTAGLWVEPADRDALCQAMLTMYADVSRRATLSVRALEQASQFSWHTCSQQTLAAYQSALSA